MAGLTRTAAFVGVAQFWLLLIPSISAPEQPRVKVEFRLAESKPAEGLSAASVVGTDEKVYLHPAVEITNEDIADAHPGLDPNLNPVIEVCFTNEGVVKAARLSETHLGKLLAILVDGKVVSAPVLKSKITECAEISGSFTMAEVERIAKGIAGAPLAAERQVVTPTTGVAMPSKSLTFVIIPICGVLLGTLTAWLTSLPRSPFRFFANHPWRVFWLLGFPLIWASLVLNIYSPLAEPGTASSRVLGLTSPISLYASNLVLALSAIQGLRLTWSASRYKGSFVVGLALVISLLETFSARRAEADLSSHFYTAVSLSASWVLASWVAHLVALRFGSLSTVSGEESRGL